ncbi:hypothetical protein KHS38_18015 [Mucilaginibacter sp. Bleaf8]|nr:hypothetical protein [Mucilaginibacter sp. Bleaf8]
MKKLLKSIMMVAVLATATVAGANAQTKTHAVHAKADSIHFRSKLKAILTPEQQAMLKANHEKQREAMKAFHATLTADQKAIMKDKALSHKERKEKLNSTLTDEQKKVMAANKEVRKANHKAFVATLSDDQKVKMKELMKDRREHGGFRRHHKADKA